MPNILPTDQPVAPVCRKKARLERLARLIGPVPSVFHGPTFSGWLEHTHAFAWQATWTCHVSWPDGRMRTCYTTMMVGRADMLRQPTHGTAIGLVAAIVQNGWDSLMWCLQQENVDTRSLRMPDPLWNIRQTSRGSFYPC